MSTKQAVKNYPKFQKYLLHDYTFLHDYIILNTYPTHHHNYNNYNSHLQIHTNTNNNNQTEQFIAQIKGTKQLVKFTKIKYHQQYMNRFQVLVQLYEKGIVLLDNLFILQQGNLMYFYIIQAYISNTQVNNIKQSTIYKLFQNSQPQQLHQSHSNSNSNININLNTTISNIKIKTQSNNISQLSQIFQSPRYITLYYLINNPYFAQIQLHLKLQLIDKIKILIECIHQIGQPFINLTPHHIIIDLEDSQSVYLAPYQLNIEIGGKQRYNNSYLAPQLLIKQNYQEKQNGKVKQFVGKEIQVNAEDMMKADIWSFGCIMLEILFYCTPAFYAINNKNQIKMIANFLKQTKNPSNFSLLNCCNMIKDKFKSKNKQNKSMMLCNLITNCLQLQPKKRILTSQKQQMSPYVSINSTNTKINIPNTVNKQSEFHQPTTLNNNPQIESQLQKQPTQNYDSQLVIYFIQISNLTIKKQLKINMYIDRRYSIYISNQVQIRRKGQNQNSYKIHKFIKIKSKLQNLCEILQKPLTLQINQNQKSAKFYLNLSTLVMQIDGKRVWNRPIIGSYKVQDNQQYKDVILKIKSQIISNNNNKSMNSEKNKFMQQLYRNIEQKRKLLKDVPIKQQKTQASNKNKQNQQAKNVTQIPIIPHKNLVLEPTNYLDKINKNLQQICQKWKPKQKNKTNQTIPSILHENKSILKQINQNQKQLNNSYQQISSPICQNKGNSKQKQKQKQKNTHQQIITSMPVSLESSRQHIIIQNQQITSRTRNKDQQIEKKIKQMLSKLKIK